MCGRGITFLKVIRSVIWGKGFGESHIVDIAVQITDNCLKIKPFMGIKLVSSNHSSNIYI